VVGTKPDAAWSSRKRSQMDSPKEKPVNPDVLVHNEGAVFLFNPLTSRAKEWVDDNVQPDAQWFGTTLVVEHRFAWALAQGMKHDGLVLE
jgi:hypothetical protein